MPEFHRFEVPVGCHWNEVREVTTNVGLAIEKALRGIEQANLQFLYGIFGDAQWSNKNKLSDRLLTDMIEHFSQYSLSNSLVDVDILGQAYEYLIKHFADLTNKKAGEFYTPRSVVHLLGLMLEPHEGENDVLFVRSSVKQSGVGQTTLLLEDFKETVYSCFIIRFRTKTDELTHLLKKYCFYEKRFRASICRRSTTSANTNINQESLNRILLTVPPKNEQEEIVRRLSEIEAISIIINSKIAISKALLKSLINQIF